MKGKGEDNVTNNKTNASYAYEVDYKLQRIFWGNWGCPHNACLVELSAYILYYLNEINQSVVSDEMWAIVSSKQPLTPDIHSHLLLLQTNRETAMSLCPSLASLYCY